MFQGRVLEEEVDLIKLDWMERLKNLFGFEILLEVFFERILILKEIYYGDDDDNSSASTVIEPAGEMSGDIEDQSGPTLNP